MNQNKFFRYFNVSAVLCALCLLFGMGSACAANPEFVYSESRNRINYAAKTCFSPGLSINNGGANLTVSIGSASRMGIRMGQSFAGKIFYATAYDDLLENAETGYDSGALFLTIEDVFKKAIVDTGDVAVETLTQLNGIPSYNDAALTQSENTFRRTLLLRPYDTAALEGILNVRQAKVLKDNLVFDIKRREQLRKRLTGTAAGSAVLAAEIQMLADMSTRQKNSIALLMNLFKDIQIGGVGGLVRGEFISGDGAEVNETYKLIFSTAARFAEIQADLARKRLLLNFFNDESGAATRIQALDELAQAHAYITQILALMNPLIDETFYSENSDVLRLSTLQAKMDEVFSLDKQGYNPFGFLPDFVPFVSGGSENSNLSTFSSMYSVALGAANLAEEKEGNARATENQYASSSMEYEKSLTDTRNSYTQRLKSLVGVVTISGSEEPDVYTFLIPDLTKNADGDWIYDPKIPSERMKERDRLAAEKGWIFGAKGQIAVQYQNIANAEIREDVALNQMQNLVNEIEIRETTAQKILGVQGQVTDNVIRIMKESGEQVGALIREKGRLQKEFEISAARRRKSSGLFASATKYLSGIAKIASGNPSGISDILSGHSGLASALTEYQVARSQAELTGQLASLDAKMQELQTMEKVQITITQAAGQQQELLLRTEQEVRIRLLEMANLELNCFMTRRDADREMTILSNMIDEVNTLLSDMNRSIKLAEASGDSVIGWVDEDVRDVLTNSVMIADQAFFRAQVWTFTALRALEYYANKAPDALGQPNLQIKSLYKSLYSARNAKDLLALLTTMDAKAQSDFVFTVGKVECPSRGLLSLKYDIITPTMVGFEADGQTGDTDTAFRFSDPETGTVYEGALAYQAAFRNVLRQGLSGTSPFRQLRIVFSTDLFPRAYLGNDTSGSNPFFDASTTTAKIVGFTDLNCSGPGMSANVQGIQVNMTGKLDVSTMPTLSFSQSGNSYLKHTKWTIADFDTNGMLINPLKNITVYSAYTQTLPTWLVQDVEMSGTKPDAETERIGSKVTAAIQSLRNGTGTGGVAKTLYFTDRSVANDRWELIIDEFAKAENRTFINKVAQMLASPVSTTDFLTDIQLWIGWAYRVEQARKK